MTSIPQLAPNEKRKLRILCADNHTKLGEVLVRLFSTTGHEVERVMNGLEAWEKLSGAIGHFNVVVTEHQMPGLSGDELTDLLRRANYPGRIIVHSSALTAGEREKYRKLRVDHVVIEQRPAEELLAIVEAFHEG
jgi:CheY-like chemotaxis protein